MNECLPSIQRSGFQHDAVVLGADWPVLRLQDNLEIIWRFSGDTIYELHAVSSVQRLIIFSANIYSEPVPLLVLGCAAIFDIEMEKQDVAPMRRSLQRRAHFRKWIINDGMDVAPQIT